jgi:hypothetical protein
MFVHGQADLVGQSQSWRDWLIGGTFRHFHICHPVGPKLVPVRLYPYSSWLPLRVNTVAGDGSFWLPEALPTLCPGASAPGLFVRACFKSTASLSEFEMEP